MVLLPISALGRRSYTLCMWRQTKKCIYLCLSYLLHCYLQTVKLTNEIEIRTIRSNVQCKTDFELVRIKWRKRTCGKILLFIRKKSFSTFFRVRLQIKLFLWKSREHCNSLKKYLNCNFPKMFSAPFNSHNKECPERVDSQMDRSAWHPSGTGWCSKSQHFFYPAQDSELACTNAQKLCTKEPSYISGQCMDKHVLTLPRKPLLIWLIDIRLMPWDSELFPASARVIVGF